MKKQIKFKQVVWIVILLVLIDQLIKFYIKLNFTYGESVKVFGLNWFQLYFIENDGMAFGMKLMDSTTGKMILTLFRLVAVVFGFFWVKNLDKRQMSNGLKICAAMILAGAAGNLVDSMFYGLLFDKGLAYDPTYKDYLSYVGLAHLAPGNGYASFLHGCVVDMFYFPIIDTTWPSWMPMVGGKRFTFFDPIFNFADACISVGVIILLFFQKRFLKNDTVPVKEGAE